MNFMAVIVSPRGTFGQWIDLHWNGMGGSIDSPVMGRPSEILEALRKEQASLLNG